MSSSEEQTVLLSRYKTIVQKAKKSRTSKQKSIISSADVSFSAFHAKKKKQELSKSFVMRQASSLSAKNKQLVDALAQNRQQVTELQETVRRLQDCYMEVVMKLNSREVALSKCQEQLQQSQSKQEAVKESFKGFHGQMQELLDLSLLEEDYSRKPSPCDPVNFSICPRRISPREPVDVKTTSPLRERCNKWKPDLAMVQEKEIDETDESVSSKPGLDKECSYVDAEDQQLTNLPISSTLHDWLNSLDAEGHESLPLNLISATNARRRNRRSTMFSRASFDPDKANFNISDVTDELSFLCSETADTAPASFRREDTYDVTSDAGAYIPHKARDTMVTIDHKMEEEKITTKRRSKSKVRFKQRFSNTSFEQENNDVTKYCNDSMDLTAPCESAIITNGQSKKTSKRRSSKKQTISKRSKSEKIVKCEKDVYNCSSDSFLLNPDKKIELSKDKVKSRSLPMSDLSNQLPDRGDSGRSRRTATVGISYAEPNLVKKMRRDY